MEQGSASVFCKGPDGECFRLCGPSGLCDKFFLYCSHTKTALGDAETNGFGCFSTTLFVGTKI